MSYFHIPHSRPLDHRKAFQFLRKHGKEQPNKEAIVFRDDKLNRVAMTFQEYNTNSCLLAAGLLQIGLVRGDRVIVLLPSRVEFVLFHMALNRIGAIMVISEENDYAAVNGIADATCIVARVEPAVFNNKKVISEIRSGLQQNAFKAAVLVGSDLDVESLNHPKAYTHQTLLAMAEKNPESSAMVRKAESLVQLDDPCMVLFTSGSTSLPKPIQYSHHAYISGALASIHNNETKKDSILFTDSPLDWVTGVGYCLITMIVQGFTLVTFPPRLALTGKHVMTYMKIFQQESVTHAPLSLYVLQDIVLHREEIILTNLEKLKVLITGGQPTPLPLIKKLFDIWPDLILLLNYGATESVEIGVQRVTKENVNSMDNGVLKATPGVELKVVDKEGQLVPLGEAGEICLRSAWVSFCNWDYMAIYKDQLQPDPCKNVNGWHFTKDQGVVVNANSFRLLGRVDSMIMCASDSIAPSEIEDILQNHPDVEKVCVVGVPDERLYQKICACLILKTDRHDNKDVLRAEFEEWGQDKFLESSIGMFIKPHYYIFLDSFPLTRTGKISRQRVMDIAVQKLGLRN